jgi:hypothetical protein
MSLFKGARDLRAQVKAAKELSPTIDEVRAAKQNPEWDSRFSQASASTAPAPPELTEPGTGTVIACYNTNLYKGDDTLFAFSLVVLPDGGLPYPITCESGVPDAYLSRCVAGAVFPVVFDRNDPSRVDIKWAAVSS